MSMENSVEVDGLRSLAGKAICVASLLHTWRPFINMLWGPIYDTRSRCPFNPTRVWLKAVEVPLKWMRAFLDGTQGTLSRTYTLAAYLQEGEVVQIVADASPTGLGAFLRIDGIIKEYAFEFISADDERILKVKKLGSEGQQVWEGLVLLAALRVWRHHWQDKRVSLQVKSDSVSALILVVKMKTSGVGTSILAREMALDIADALYEPSVCEHIPGIANVIADHLSRISEQAGAPLPAQLCHARRRCFEPRDVKWWRTL